MFKNQTIDVIQILTQVALLKIFFRDVDLEYMLMLTKTPMKTFTTNTIRHGIFFLYNHNLICFVYLKLNIKNKSEYFKLIF